MLMDVPYNRSLALDYVNKWVFQYNPRYYNFDKIGGDCTNFASQVLYAGCGTMNYSENGWFYNNVNHRSPSWCSVEFLYRFLINNKGCGPSGEQIDLKDLQCGDLVQLSIKGERFEHSPVVVAVHHPISLANVFVSTHSRDVHNYSLSHYKWADIRFIHIDGAKKWC